MGKKIAKRYKVGRSITAALLVFSLGVGLSLTLSASAVTLNLPADTATQSGGAYSVRGIQSGGSSFGEGINLGPSSPSGTPGASTTQPVPQFSMVNTPAVVNDDGPLEVPDDLRVYGLTEVMGGLINNGEPVFPDLWFSLAADTPVASTVQKGATNVNVARIDVFGQNSNTIITDIYVTRTGTATNADVPSIEAYAVNSGGSESFIGNGTLVAGSSRYRIQTNWSVTGGQEAPDLLIKASIASGATVGSTFAMGVSSASDVVAQKASGTGYVPGAVVMGNFAIRGNTHAIVASTTTPTLTVAVAGDTPTCSSVTKGTSGNSTTKLSFTAGGGDVKISSLVFTRGGTATENDINNVSIMDVATGTVIPSSVVNNPSDKTKYTVTFTSPVQVLVGTTVNLMVRAAVGPNADTGKTFNLGINSNAEIVANKLSSAVGTDPVTAAGAFPVKGNTCVISDTGTQSTTPTLTMSPANPVAVAVSTTSTTVTITLNSTAANTSTTTVNTAVVNIKNNQHVERTFDITLTETGANTGIFTSTFSLNALAGTYKPSTKTMEVEMCNDNSIYGRYPIASSGSAQAGYTLIAHPNPPACGAGSAVVIPPSVGGPDAVEAVTLLGPDFAEKSPIALFGSFIPTAYAASGFPEPDSGSELLHPVTVFDDLYVFGNGAVEPGNAVINGFLRAGQDGLTSQISGNLNLLGALVTVSDDLDVLGNTTAGYISATSLLVSNGAGISGGLSVGGNLNTSTITTTTLSASASVTAGSIGQFYRVSNTTLWSGDIGYRTTTAFCSSGDILISCNGRSTTYTSVQVLGSSVTTSGCETKFYRSIATTSKNLISEATCFDPNASGERPSQPADPTDGSVTTWTVTSL